ncbi:MAG: preprotein translocase subunit SecG [Flavobacteriaceae bacterium]|nr:preprotein translocase subunit SecG [Flavobacteriaceae bacterium]MCY4215752.1 preprotein translocase subunit SecG [Flavobacteriaceae bacterium]MCY4254014.1 preprotein translocase subunit SecG [Flavobacteriaceae bacterium]
MFTIFIVLIILICLLLILVIMVQNPKGGGLSSAFGGAGSQQLGGVQKTTDFLDRSTWVLAIFLLVLILMSNVTLTRQGNVDSILLDDTVPVEEVIPETLPEQEPTPVEDLPELPEELPPPTEE